MKTFEVNLANQSTAGWLASGFTVITFALAITMIVCLQGYSDAMICMVFLSIFAGLMYGFVLLSKKVVVIEPSLVTIAGDRIRVLNRNSGDERIVLFDDIASCRYSANGEDKYLRIKRKDSTTFRLSDKSEEFAAIIKELESTLIFYQQPAAISLLASETGDKDAIGNQLSGGKTPLILREKTFFEKPVANVLGWIIAAGLCYFSWHLFQYGVKDGKWGSAFMIYGNGLAYLAAWRNARRARKE